MNTQNINIKREAKNLIDALKYQIIDLSKDIEKNHSEIKDLKRTLLSLENLYNQYLTANEKEKGKIAKELMRYLKNPWMLNFIEKIKIGLATILIAATPVMVAGCSSSKEESNEIEEIINEDDVYYTVTFKDYDGSILNEELVLKESIASAIKEPTRENYEFTGWYLNGEKYDFNSLVTSNLILEAKYQAPIYVLQNECIEKIQQIKNDQNLNFWSSSLGGNALYYNVTSIKEFMEIAGILDENRELFSQIKVEFTNITLEDVELLKNLPNNLIYALGFADDFSEISLKEYISNLKLTSIALYSGNINEEDLAYFMNYSNLDIHLYSEDFDKFNLLNELCPENRPGFLSVALNQYAKNQRIIIPNFKYTTVYNSLEAKNSEIICQSMNINIGAENCWNLNIKCPNDSSVAIYSVKNIEEVIEPDDIFQTRILKSLLNVNDLKIQFLDYEIIGEKSENGIEFFITEEIPVGYINSHGYHQTLTLSK